MQVLIDAREKLNIPWEHSHSHKAASLVMTYKSGYDLDLESFRHNAPIIHRLWQDRAIKKAFDRRREFQLVSTVRIIDSKFHQLTDLNFSPMFFLLQSDTVSFFFDEIDRIARVDYMPSNKDVLHCRKATKGIFEFTIRIQVRHTQKYEHLITSIIYSSFISISS